MGDDLSEFPDALRDTERYPWDEAVQPHCWQWGADRGKLLTEIPSRELVRKRNWLMRDREAFHGLIEAIDTILIDRAGE